MGRCDNAAGGRAVCQVIKRNPTRSSGKSRNNIGGHGVYIESAIVHSSWRKWLGTSKAQCVPYGHTFLNLLNPLFLLV